MDGETLRANAPACKIFGCSGRQLRQAGCTAQEKQIHVLAFFDFPSAQRAKGMRHALAVLSPCLLRSYANVRATS